ncbi:MAG: SDR family NAD(P)-dependent oxidoreductase [Promethearchaeota archaeon]
MLLKDKNIVITGSGRGIGKYIALLCAEEGANIGLASRTLEELHEVKQKIESLGFNVTVSIKAGDIMNYKDVENIFNHFYDTLGPLNGVIANAGWRTGAESSLTLDVDIFRKTLDINILGVYFTFRASYPYIKKDDKQDKARFIITGSEHYRAVAPLYLAYTTCKYAVVGLMDSLSKEFRKENITFNMVLPTRTDTRLTRGKLAEDGDKPDGFLNPWDISDYYLFLLTKESNRINNELLRASNFQHVKRIISEAPSQKNNDIKIFMEYLQDQTPNLFQETKKLEKFVEFLLFRKKE